MNKVILACLAIVISIGCQGQILEGFEKRNKERKKNKAFSSGDRGKAIYSHSRSHYRPFGWHVSPGVTYMFGNTKADDGSSENLTPNGLPGYYVEGGFAHLFKQRHIVLHYFDYAIGMKHYGGLEKYVNTNNEAVRGSFNFGSAFARIDIHSVWQLTEWNFINQSIGLNFDYRIYGGNVDPDYQTPFETDFQEKYVTQLHYSIGWGYKPRDGLFIIPTIQTPIVTLLNWRDFNPGTRWFSSKYQPIIFTVKLGVLLPKKGCPKVFSRDAKRQAEQYQNR